jgi:hypothetical protein
VKEHAVREVRGNCLAYRCGWLGSAGRGELESRPLAPARAAGAARAAGSAASESECSCAASARGGVEFVTIPVKGRVWGSSVQCSYERLEVTGNISRGRAWRLCGCPDGWLSWDGGSVLFLGGRGLLRSVSRESVVRGVCVRG